MRIKEKLSLKFTTMEFDQNFEDWEIEAAIRELFEECEGVYVDDYVAKVIFVDNRFYQIVVAWTLNRKVDVFTYNLGLNAKEDFE